MPVDLLALDSGINTADKPAAIQGATIPQMPDVRLRSLARLDRLIHYLGEVGPYPDDSMIAASNTPYYQSEPFAEMNCLNPSVYFQQLLAKQEI